METIASIPELLHAVKEDSSTWGKGIRPWFRGEPESKTPVLPSLYRGEHDEDLLLQHFRLKASVYGLRHTPPRDRHTDQWLFLAQHHGLPTRLLDWTEGALVALLFALQEKSPVLWMLNPIAMNNLSLPADRQRHTYSFDWTWVESDDPINIYNENIRGAWQKDNKGTDLPVAVLTTYTHPRMSAQRSCFTVHGRKKESLSELVPPSVLKRYSIDPSVRDDLIGDLDLLGVSCATVFPDLDGLAKDLRNKL